MSTTMQGKICLITGATNGIGKSTAMGLARMGGTVVIVGRNAGKTARTVDEIRPVAQENGGRVDSLLADLSSLRQIRDLAEEFKRRYSRLHVLINNAGGWFQRREVTVDGLEMNFAYNHLAYFLLTNLLLDTLIASAPARIINVTSQMYKGGKLDFSDLQSERSYSRARSYSNSKLANVLFTVELARRLEGTGVTANTVHPGMISSGFYDNEHNRDLASKVMGALMPLMMPDSEKGAETSIYLASSPAVEGVTGKYFVASKSAPLSAAAADPESARKLWVVSTTLANMQKT
jgi:NAD(P)-dependent dehydrogenase (short-subunit alcohol dehydrogenase family)